MNGPRAVVVLLTLVCAHCAWAKSPQPTTVPTMRFPAPVPARAPGPPAQPWLLVSAGTVEIAGGQYQVDTRIPWSARRGPKGEAWTVDGTPLNLLVFQGGIEEGDALTKDEQGTAYPAFRKSMSPVEIVELVLGTLALSGARVSPARNVVPVPFGPTEGFRFETDLVVGPGMEKTALVTGAVLEEKLYLIFFAAPSRFFYEKYRPEVEHIMASVSPPPKRPAEPAEAPRPTPAPPPSPPSAGDAGNEIRRAGSPP